jgi:hypothetical protein
MVLKFVYFVKFTTHQANIFFAFRKNRTKNAVHFFKGNIAKYYVMVEDT